MESNTPYIFISIGILVFLVIFIGIMTIIYKIFKTMHIKSESMQTSSSQNNAQDFSAFESSPDKFRSNLANSSDETAEEEEEETDEVIKGDMSNLVEFLDTLKSQPPETLSSIQISKDEDNDLLIAFEVDEEEGFFMEAYFPEEETNIPYPEWIVAMRTIINELSLDATDSEEEDELITINLEGKTSSEIKHIVERILSDGYLNKLGNSFLVEYLA